MDFACLWRDRPIRWPHTGADTDMTLHPAERLPEQLERLRALYTLLSSERDSRRHDDLLERTRIAIADVRRTRALLASGSRVRPTSAEARQAD